VKDVRDALMVARASDGRLVRRPLSPHLMDYRLDFTTVLSGLHRITGLGLGIGTLLLTWWLVAAATSAEAFDTVQGFIGSPIGLLMLFGWTFSLFFHLCNGIRHLAWDLGLGFEKAQYTMSGQVVAAASVALTVLVWIVGLVIW
jgi:succinate dehydrogenase / fumarate reductase, cytochrome b subunit